MRCSTMKCYKVWLVVVFWNKYGQLLGQVYYVLSKIVDRKEKNVF